MPKQTEEKERLLAQLGRNQNVLDIERAYQGLVEWKDKVKRILARKKVDHEHALTELQLYLDDFSTITGLQPNQPLFWQILGRTIRLKQLRKQLGEEEEYVPAFMDGFGDMEQSSLSDLPSDDDMENEIKRRGRK
jgi:hypothetical protein